MNPSRFATLSVAAILKESADRFGESTALSIAGTSIRYRDLWEQTKAYAGALRDLEIGPGDTVAVLIPNVPDFARVYYAILSLGGVVVPIHALLKSEEIHFVLSDSGAKLLVCAEPLIIEGAAGAGLAGIPVISVMTTQPNGAIPALEELCAQAEPIESYKRVTPDDTATILYTSGTTGKPKGAMGSHFAIVEQTNVLLQNTFDIKSDDIIFGGLPLFHTFGQICALNTSFRAGAEVVLVPRFEGASALETLVDSRCTIMMGVPTMYVALLEAARSTTERPPLRYAISGGSAIPLAVIDRFRSEFGIEIYEGYGLTETSPVATFNHVGRQPRAGSIGTPIWGVDVEIADADKDDSVELLPHGELGELVVRGHNLMNGYLNQPEADAHAIVDGWFRTGDLGTKDADGYLWIVDRKKDMILRNGYNVYPREVEEILSAHPRVTAAAVFGVTDETHGQEVMGCVVLTPGEPLAPQDLVDYARNRLAAYKYPRHIFIVDSLPLGPSGKVLKRELVARFEEPGGVQ
jgi:long-chain acyl-CoA synthetase